MKASTSASTASASGRRALHRTGPQHLRQRIFMREWLGVGRGEQFERKIVSVIEISTEESDLGRSFSAAS